MDHSVAFVVHVVPVVVDISIQRFGVDPEIPDHQSFEEEAECVQIVYQILRAYPERCSRQGRVDEISRIGCADCGLRTQIRVPCAHILHDMQLPERLEILRHRLFGHAGPVIGGYLCRQEGLRDLASLIPGIRPEEHAHLLRIPPHTIHARHVSSDHGIDVVERLIQSHVLIHIDRLRPSSSAYEERQPVYIQIRASRYLARFEQRCKTHIPCGVSRFEEGHRTHDQPAESSCAGVDRLRDVGRHGGACKNELALALVMVHVMPHGVPQLGCDLPFVQKPRLLPIEQLLRIDLRKYPIGIHCSGIVNRKDAAGELFRRGGLAAPFGTFYQHRPLPLEFPSQCGVHYAGPVREALLLHILRIEHGI